MTNREKLMILDTNLIFIQLRRTKMIVELLDKYHVDDFDDLLIEIIKHMKEQKETRQEDDNE